MTVGDFQAVSLDQLARLIGVESREMPVAIVDALRSQPLFYRRLGTAERDAVLLRLLEQLLSPDLSPVGKHRQEVWDRGWKETLDDFVGSGYEVGRLIPKYTRLGEAIRFDGDYAQPRDSDFEVRLSKYQRQTLFHKYFADCERAYEFGCGTGLNLVYLSEVLPRIRVVGLDWVDSSRKLIEAIAIRHPNVTFRLFNFFDFVPFDLGPQSGVCTVTALEQVGEECKSFLEFLINARPRIVVHIEPIEDMYDSKNFFGYIGQAYHRKRRYLSGFMQELERLEATGRIRILQKHHTGFGIQRHDPFSLIAWRPV
jgi:SAM-dependent methyltransferase